nr:asparagine synthase-related protein [Actinomycetota bacterium]
MFAGVLCFDGARPPADLVDAQPLLAALSPGRSPDATGTWRDGPFLVVQASTRVCRPPLPGYGTITLPHRCAESGLVVVFWGRLDERDALASELGLPTTASTDERLVLAAYERWGTSCPAKLTGDFAGAIWDPQDRRVLLFRDRLGVKPLYYLCTDSFLAFATTAAVFPHLRRQAPEPDMDWAARLLAGASPSQTATGWTGVSKLAPGHLLDVRAGRVRLERYHTWRDDPPWATRRDQRHVDEYRAVLEEAVRCRIPGAGLIGSESSGGLDSSTVTALLGHLLDDPGARLVAFGFAMLDMEPELIIETSRHAGIVQNYLITGVVEPTDAVIARGLAALGYPEDAESAMGHVPFYEECDQHGIKTLFSGFGGDEAVTNSGSLLRRELVDHRSFGALWRLLPGGQLTRTLR